MLIHGVWHQCPDGVFRPVMLGEVLSSDGTWHKARFLVDTGADRTVFSSDVLSLLQLQAVQTSECLLGAGGVIASTFVDTEIRFSKADGAKAVFKGRFAGCTHAESLDITILGRDIIELFSLIVDRQGDVVCLVGQEHCYSIGNR